MSRSLIFQISLLAKSISGYPTQRLR